MATAVKKAQPQIGFRVDTLRGLSRRAKDYLRRHPKDARKVVADALESAAEAAATVTYKVNGKTIEVPKRLVHLIDVPKRRPELIGIAEAANRLKVSQKTVRGWVKDRVMLGWKTEGRGLVVPKEQIMGPGKVAPGIKELVAIIDGDPSLTWIFLQKEWPFEHDVMRPIDKLKAGKVEEVLGTAPGFGSDFT